MGKEGVSGSEKERRSALREDIEAIQKEAGPSSGRYAFFDAVYEEAAGQEARVPWADLEPKAELLQWLGKNSSLPGQRAIDVGCGLGDNAEALASAGYDTVAFDYSEKAVNWAKRRFPDSAVSYRAADLFGVPPDWIGGFDLVNECFTLQALPPDMLDRTAAAVASLVRPGGMLLVYTRYEPGGRPSGPPWPLPEERLDMFMALGFDKQEDRRFELFRQDGSAMKHAFMVWRRRMA
jgi:2-polyprenyl-3-methyl-5-hydroxy-6-metoxy-1,4-benzoquinol methylase